MKEVFRKSKDFLILEALFLIASECIVIFTDKAELHLWINQWHHPFCDFIFRHANHLAEGYFLLFAVFLAALIKVRHGVMLAVAFGLSSLATQFMKHFIFEDVQRPIKFFNEVAQLRLLDDIAMHGMFAFPSGHATAAFSMFFVLAFLSRSRIVEMFCFGMALLTSFSRVYISQHFFEDIVAGSLVGTTGATCVTLLFQNLKWGDYGLIKMIQKNLPK